MTISSTTRKAGPFVGNGVTTDFPFDFKLFETADLRVVRADALGVETDLVHVTDCTVTLNADQDENPGGSVVLNAPLATGDRLVLLSAVPELQPVDLTNQGGFYPELVNGGLDRSTVLVQQLREEMDRSIRLPVTAEPGDLALPAPTPGQLLGWTDSGLANFDPSSLVSVVAYGSTRVDKFDGDGVENIFLLSASPGVQNNLRVSVGGVTQTPAEDFTWIGGTILSFSVPPPAGTRIVVQYQEALVEFGSAAADLSNVPDIAVQNKALADTARVQDIALSALQISPENFYQTADAGDWAPAFARMETFRQALSSTGLQTPIRLRKGNYTVKSPINMKVGVNDSLFMYGAGHMLDGSRISPVAGWTGGTTPVLTIEGDAGANTNAQFVLQGFAIVQPEGSGVAESGLMVKNINGPSGASCANDIYLEGFKYPLTTTNARLIEWNRICIWSRNIANAEPIRVTSDGVGAFGGDMTFNQCQTVAGVPGTYTSPNGSAGVHISAANGGETRGIRFNGYIGYHADTAVKIRATANGTAGGIVGDIWFNPGCQFDQTVIKPWDIQTAQSGANHGTIFSINFIGCYWSTILGSHDTATITGTRANAPNQINANSGLVSELHIVDCMIPNFSKNLFFKNVVGLHFTDNDLYGYGNPSVSLDAIVVLEDCYNVKMRGNVARATANNISYAVIVSGGGSIEIDGWSGSVTAVRDWGAVVRKEMWGRLVLRGPIPTYVDNAAAAAAGVLVDEVYRTATGALMVRY